MCGINHSRLVRSAYAGVEQKPLHVFVDGLVIWKNNCGVDSYFC